MADARKAVSPPDLIITTPKIAQKAVPIGELVDLYFKRKIVERGEPPKTETESRQRFQKHFSIHWSKTPSEIAELDLLRIRYAILKSGGKMATVSWLLGFYRTLIRFAVQAKLSPALEYQLPVPKASELKNRDRALNKGGIKEISGGS